MNLANFFLQSFRIVLLPVALIYGGIIHLRNYFFDKQWLTSAYFNFPIICVGNLSVGGTGKSPMIEFLIRRLAHKYPVAVLSRGYKRKTKGYLMANEQTTAIEIGDEPMQFFQKFPTVPVAVGEERVVAIPQILHDRPDTRIILLDDAFQHRSIQPGFSILLTEAADLFTRDFYLPTGNLRDQKSSYKRADIIVVTKCPENLSAEAAAKIKNEMNPLPHQKVLFSKIVYGKPYHFLDKQISRTLSAYTDVLLVTGIANFEPLKKMLTEQAHGYDQLSYGDHHIFTIDDVEELHHRYQKLTGKDKMILTTEKDAVRLIKFKEALKSLPIFVIPIEHEILFNEEEVLMRSIERFVEHFDFPQQQTIQS
ncbi:MAG: tetraacyldisaccharide 4'-kinase [Bacteroidetes bacterium]|nr:tetraacyldisaccharide 4'-kinase [Bacteroidota bacterium]